MSTDSVNMIAYLVKSNPVVKSMHVWGLEY